MLIEGADRPPLRHHAVRSACCPILHGRHPPLKMRADAALRDYGRFPLSRRRTWPCGSLRGAHAAVGFISAHPGRSSGGRGTASGRARRRLCLDRGPADPLRGSRPCTAPCRTLRRKFGSVRRADVELALIQTAWFPWPCRTPTTVAHAGLGRCRAACDPGTVTPTSTVEAGTAQEERRNPATSWP